MIKGFKDFIMRGNVIDLAVAVVIGAAFTAVVNAIVSSIITRLSSRCSGKLQDNGVPGYSGSRAWGPVTFPIGDLISALISFLSLWRSWCMCSSIR